MNTGKVLASAIVGTSAMTLFSYLISKKENKNYREPEILGQLVKRLPTDTSKKSADIAGWFAHYTVGTLFVTLYNELWKRKKIEPTFTSGALLGAASGIVGIVGWKLFFESHPNPPAKNLKSYFGHLFLAHIVFGIFSSATYKLADANKNIEQYDLS
jgi:hypothetical protein